MSSMTEGGVNSDVTWLWEAERDAQLFDAAIRHGTRSSAFGITFNSAAPLPHEVVHQAFRLLQRKAPNLRTCLRPRNGRLWYCQPHQFDVDFKVLDEDVDMEEEVYRLTQQGFTYTEPSQWRVRLIPRGQAAFCEMPEVKVNFPYQCDCFILAHHAIADGLSQVILIQGVLDILNDLLSDRPVNDAVQLGEFSKAEEIVQVKCKIRENLIRNPQRLEALIGTLPPPEKSLLLLEAFHRPPDATPGTRHVRRVLEPWVIDGFQEKIKTMGVTFNSFFVAVIHAVITELAREEGIVRDSYRLSSLHLVNLRRYMKSWRPLPLGDYTASLSYSVDVGKDVRETFWQHCRKINQELQDHLKLGVALEQKVAVEMAEEAISTDDYYDNPPTVTHDFTVSNIGDISFITPGVGKHVQITSLQPLITIHKYIHMNFHQTFTFRGRCSYTLSYVTDYMTQETANRLADKVVFLLEGLISK